MVNAPVVDPEHARFVDPEVVVPPAEKQEFVESSQKLFSADLDVPIEGAELEVSRSREELAMLNVATWLGICGGTCGG